MNERIRELAKEALDYAERNQSAEVPQHWFKLYNEKFAELIVRESIVDFYRNYLDTTSDDDITEQVDRYVKQNFGVE